MTDVTHETHEQVPWLGCSCGYWAPNRVTLVAHLRGTGEHDGVLCEGPNDEGCECPCRKCWDMPGGDHHLHEQVAGADELAAWWKAQREPTL